MIERELFGVTADGMEVTLYRIRNSFGEFVELLDYGAALHSAHVLGGSGSVEDVVLGARNAADLTGFTLEGVTVGRCANRIADARFVLEGKEYQLDVGRGGHCLHSGSGNYAFRHFEAAPCEAENKVAFSLRDSGEGGFGCAALARVSFSFDDSHRLSIEYEITPEGTTVLSPTNHAFFNLGCADARDHVLCVHAHEYAVKGEGGVPRGAVAPVEGTPLDFHVPRTLRAALEGAGDWFGQGRPEYDENLLLEGSGLREVAWLFAPPSGRGMRVYTDMPSLVLFTFAAPRPIHGKNGAVYTGFRSVCLETQFVTNAVNCPAFYAPVFHQGETLRSRTVYEFYTGEADQWK